jgi:hypothetical protein
MLTLGNKKSFAKNFTKQEESFRLCCFSEGCRGDRGPSRGQRAVEMTEDHRGDRGLKEDKEPSRGQRVI